MAILGKSFIIINYKLFFYFCIKSDLNYLFLNFRSKLNKVYGDERVSKGREPVPAHLFGNMWAQTWGALYDIAAPFPNAGKICMMKVNERSFLLCRSNHNNF